MIPPFDNDSGNLSPGIHEARWSEFVERFGYNERRRMLLNGLRGAISSLRRAGCRTVYVDGSFITDRQFPNDFDACWDEDGVSPEALDPVFLTFTNQRAAQKEKFQGEFFPCRFPADETGTRYLDFFQRSRDGTAKGIILIQTGDVPL